MTTIKVYCDEFSDNYIEVSNAEMPNDINEPKNIALKLSLDGVKDIMFFYLGREDAIKLTQYLKEQLRF